VIAFGDRVRQARQRIRTPGGGRLTQGDLALAVGVERNTVSRWENSGVRPKDPQVVRKLAEVLQVSMEWLFAESEPELGTLDLGVAGRGGMGAPFAGGVGSGSGGGGALGAGHYAELGPGGPVTGHGAGVGLGGAVGRGGGMADRRGPFVGDRPVQVPYSTTEVLAHRLPPRAYERVHDYIERVERAGATSAQAEESARVLLDAATTRLRASAPRERSIETVLADIDAAWRYLATVLTDEGRDV